MRIRTSKKHVRVLAALWSEMVSWIKRYIYIYTGWWFHPSENMSSLVGMMKFPTEWKNKNMFQTTNQYIYTYIYIYQQHHEGSGWLANPSTTYEYMTWIWGHPKYFLTGQRIYTQLESGALIKEYQSYPTQQSNFDMGKTQGKPTHQLCKKMIDPQEVRWLDLQKDQRWETWLVGLQTPRPQVEPVGSCGFTSWSLVQVYMILWMGQPNPKQNQFGMAETL